MSYQNYLPFYLNAYPTLSHKTIFDHSLTETLSLDLEYIMTASSPFHSYVVLLVFRGFFSEFLFVSCLERSGVNNVCVCLQNTV